MATNKTVETDASVTDFIQSVENGQRQQDSWEMLEMMEEITGHPPKLWGNSLVGFGSYHYRYDSGREGDFFLTGFSPRKTALTVYVMPGFERYKDQLERLGPYKTGRSCLYLKKLDTVDREVLKEIIRDSVSFMKDKYNAV